MNLLQQAAGKQLPVGLAWTNEPSDWFIEGVSLVVTAPPECDYFCDPEGRVSLSAPYLHTRVKGDFTLTARVDVDMTEMFDSACLMVFADENHWAKLCYENWLNEPAIVSVVTRKLSDDCPSLRIGRVKPYLKIIRSGHAFGFHYSIDASNWTIIRYFSLDVPEEIAVGLVAQSPVGKGCRVVFDSVELVIGPVVSAKFV